MSGTGNLPAQLAGCLPYGPRTPFIFYTLIGFVQAFWPLSSTTTARMKGHFSSDRSAVVPRMAGPALACRLIQLSRVPLNTTRIAGEQGSLTCPASTGQSWIVGSADAWLAPGDSS